MAKIGDVCASKIDTLSAAYNGKIDYIDISAVDNREKKITQTAIVLAKDAPSRAKQLVEHGDVIVSLVRPNLNAVAIIEEQSQNLQVASTGYCVLRCNQMIYNRYLFYFCQSETFVNSMTAQATGASYPAVSNSIVKNCEIPLPERNKQKEIADILDKVTELISLRKQQLAKLDELVKARFVEMFGDPDQNPKGWPLVSITEIIRDKASNGFFAKRDAYKDDGNVQILGVSNVVNRMYSNTKELPRTNATQAEKEKYSVKYGDMLFCRSSLVADGIGKASIVAKGTFPNVLFECHVIRLSLDLQKCVPEFVQVLSTTPFFRRQIIAQSKTATMTTIGQDGILKSSVVLPPIDLQNQFAAFVERVDQQKQTVQQSLDKLELMKKALMQEYFG